MTQSKPDIILYGGPAAGKSTQAQILIKKLSAAHMYAGRELRELATKNTDLGRKVKTIVNAGKLVPGTIITKIAEKFIIATPKGKRIIFDGYPRSVAQARQCMKMLKQHGRDAVLVSINLPLETALARLTTRSGHGDRQDDIDPKAIRTRVQIFKKQAKPLQDMFRQMKKYASIDGTQSVAKVNKEILSKIS